MAIIAFEYVTYTSLPGAAEALVIDDDTGEEVAIGEIGRLHVAGPALFDGYVNQTQRLFCQRNGKLCFSSEDLVRREKAGFTFCGRADGLVKVGAPTKNHGDGRRLAGISRSWPAPTHPRPCKANTNVIGSSDARQSETGDNIFPAYLFDIDENGRSGDSVSVADNKGGDSDRCRCEASADGSIQTKDIWTLVRCLIAVSARRLDKECEMLTKMTLYAIEHCCIVRVVTELWAVRRQAERPGCRISGHTIFECFHDNQLSENPFCISYPPSNKMSHLGLLDFRTSRGHQVLATRYWVPSTWYQVLNNLVPQVTAARRMSLI